MKCGLTAFIPEILLDTDGGAGGAADGDGGAASLDTLADAAKAASGEGASDAGGQDPNANNGDAGSGEAYRPEGLPEHYMGKTNNETIDNLFKAVDGYRKQQGDQAVPRDVEGYKFDASDKLKPYLEHIQGDDLWKGVLEDAMSAGVTDKAFAAFMPKVLERLLDTGEVQLPVDYNDHLAQLVPDAARTLDDQAQAKAVTQRIEDALAFLDGAKAKGLDAEVADFLTAQLGDSALGIRAIEYFQGNHGRTGPAMGGSKAGDVTAAELNARIVDPRNDPKSPRFEKDYAAETDRLSKEIHGTQPNAMAPR